jgi:hypothetical protein
MKRLLITVLAAAAFPAAVYAGPNMDGNGRNDPNGIPTQLAVYNPQQKARIEALLPKHMTLEQASTGFRNQWQLLAALNAAHTHKIPFARLKTALILEGLSLREAVDQLKTPRPSSRIGG